MKLIILASTLPSMAYAFAVNGCDKMGRAVTVQDIQTRAFPAYSQYRKPSQLQAHSPQDIDKAFEELEKELKNSQDTTSPDEVVSKSKKWVNRYFDLFAGINRDLADSEEDVARNEKALRKQQELTNKVIDFAVDFGKDLSSIDLDGFRRPARKTNESQPKKTSPISRGPMFEPVHGVQDDDQVFQVEFELPGVNLDDVAIELEKDNVLVISGQRQSIGTADPMRFSKRFVLDPTVNTEKISAKLDKGILTVSAPKENKKDPNRRIPVVSGN